ncbi:MAG: hypothetical protein KKF85_15415 [Gammaproteobacteria bacterium]|nr:hypothetical protein [Rhodocyclaceae bacterium]MBU3907945.1 hypothetical protein [Gammaproteobacteria bacterium]MBU3989787.1 hypothetical protein [Gammaproteobacteria bacterium]MBU4003851.1 hypothetical protein [Gammaproteobacteria bacterium]MBU4021729.1 hypothetical protein [Gammaproteobacteria bacterium]
MDTRFAVELALAHAADYQRSGRTLDRAARERILYEVLDLEERDQAAARRNAALCEAFAAAGYSVSLLANQAAAFLSNKWPVWRWWAAPPPEAGRLASALFAACRAASALSADGVARLPEGRQLRNIVQSPASDFTRAA